MIMWLALAVCWVFFGILAVLKYCGPDKSIRALARETMIATVVFVLWPIVILLLWWAGWDKARRERVA